MSSRRILIAIDKTETTKTALSLIKNYLPTQEICLVGLVVDVEGYSELLSTAASKSAYGLNTLQLKVESTKKGEADFNELLIEDFITRCQTENLQFEIHRDKGIPAMEIVNETRFVDTVIIGAETCFESNKKVKPDKYILPEVLAESHCPVIVIPDNNKGVKNIVFAFNGSDSNIFAIKEFCHTIDTKSSSLEATLLCIDDGSSIMDLTKDDKNMQKYLQTYFDEVNILHMKGDVKDGLDNAIELISDPMLVMGAYGRSAISMFFKPSKADEIFSNKDIPVFIAHK